MWSACMHDVTGREDQRGMARYTLLERFMIRFRAPYPLMPRLDWAFTPIDDNAAGSSIKLAGHGGVNVNCLHINDMEYDKKDT